MNSSRHRRVSVVALTPVLVFTACARPATYAAQETSMQTTLGTVADAARPESRDRAAITQTIEAIARGADLHQWEAVRAAFAEEVELDYGTPERLSPDTVVDRWQALLEGFDVTQHVIRDIRVQVDGDRATATSRFEATHFLQGATGGDVWILTGRYEHSLRRTASGWKVTRMRMTPEASRGNESLVDKARAKGASRAAATGQTLRARNREAVRSFFRQLEAMDTGDAFVALFTEDARQLMPFAPPGFPTVLDGREAIRKQYASLPTAYTHMRFPGLVIRDLASPNEFFVTYKGDIGLASGGRYANDYAGYFVVHDGRIAEFHEFFNPIVLRQAFGERLGETFNVKP
jgi:ketosteroid isomerase-like protein